MVREAFWVGKLVTEDVSEEVEQGEGVKEKVEFAVGEEESERLVDEVRVGDGLVEVD